MVPTDTGSPVESAIHFLSWFFRIGLAVRTSTFEIFERALIRTVIARPASTGSDSTATHSTSPPAYSARIASRTSCRSSVPPAARPNTRSSAASSTGPVASTDTLATVCVALDALGQRSAAAASTSPAQRWPRGEVRRGRWVVLAMVRDAQYCRRSLRSTP
jgi:hypothetical protein